MSTRIWQMKIVFLCALLIIPVITHGEEATELNLVWYNLETGELEGTSDPKNFPDKAVSFPLPTSCDAAALKCKVGEKELENCEGEIAPSNVTHDGSIFVVSGTTTEVKCVDANNIRITGTESAVADKCIVQDQGQIMKTWAQAFELVVPSPSNRNNLKKAFPWNGEKVYCPDAREFPEAYEFKRKENTREILDEILKKKISEDLARRYIFDACSRVVDSYLKSCAKELSVARDATQAIVEKKNKTISSYKIKSATSWLGSDYAASCTENNNWWENKSGSCWKRWLAIKGLMQEDKAFSSVSESKEGWKVSETLNDFLSRLAKATFDNDEISSYKYTDFESEYNSAKAAEAPLKAVVTFLRKRFDSLRLGGAISATKTFKVSSWLRLNDTSKETELKLLGDTQNDENNVFAKVIKLVIQIFGALGVLLLIISGVMMVVSQGEETMLQKSKQTFIYTLVGLIIGFLSYTIVRFILELLLMR